MKKSFMTTLTLVLVAMFALSSCSAKLRPLTSKQVQVDPLPLEVRGSQVAAKVHVSFPEKSFPKKAVLHMTPVLRYTGGEKWGQTYTYQGEQVYGNDVVIPYKEGASLTLMFGIPYVPAMSKSELYLVFKAKIGSKERKLPDLKIGSGVIATETLATLSGVAPAIAHHGFERIIKEAYDANIMFQIQQADVRSKELNKDEVEEWRYIVQNAKEAPNQEVDVEVQAYASPDGGRQLNERLSEQRERNTTASLKREFKKQDLGGVAISAHYTAQDWEGFKTLVSESDLPDKDLVLRVLSMYSDPEQREREIKNISAVFSQLTQDVLPKLRRSRLIANVKIIGKTDEEIQDWLAKSPGHLTIEELLYAATLASNNEEKMSIYQLVNKIFPRDYRAYNNIGALLYADGKPEQAEIWFTQAQKRSDNAATKLNQGLIALTKGDVEQGDMLIASAAEAPEYGQALGYIFLKRGEYAKAETAFGSTISHNAAVAQLLNKNYAGAMKTLEALAPENAKTQFLKAIVSMRMGRQAAALTALQEVAKLDVGMLSGLDKNLEFASLFGSSEFSKIVSALPIMQRN
ncbi:MAG: hypothetical protein Q4A61_03390 [Porphyromonadaceae bacterium]|nr:hypothetical protein [Porphyromonadaceae bacterium]